MNIAVLASGSSKIKLLITDKKNAFARRRASRLKIKDLFIDPKKSKNRLAYDKAIVKVLKKEKIDLILLAGYMRVLSPYFIKQFKNKILNIHPALLPSFKGTDSIKRAFDYGVKVTGVTVHFVDSKVAHGPIILQEEIKITPKTTLSTLTKQIHALEHKLYPKAVKLFATKKLTLSGRKVS